MSIARVFRSAPFYRKLQLFLASLYGKQYQRLGWEAQEGESARTATLRATVIQMMGMSGGSGNNNDGDGEVHKKAYELFGEMTNPANADVVPSVPGDLQKVIFKLALHYDEAKTFEALRALFEQVEGSPEEKRNCLSTMGAVIDPHRHAHMLDYVFLSGKVRRQDLAFPLNALASTSDQGGKATWKYFCTNFTVLQTKYGAGPNWGSIVGLVCRGLTQLVEADEAQVFFQSQPNGCGSATRRLEQALEIVRTRAQRRERDGPALADFLQTYGG
jgi:hypothetical protein